LRVHCSANVTEQLEAVFYERGAPEELLTDNDTAFRGITSTEFIGWQWHSGEMPSKRKGHRCEKELHGGRGGVLVQRHAARRPQPVDSPG
ncbi:hypothetical protein T4E_4612, partial [Trichinella pseudospiralis]